MTSSVSTSRSASAIASDASPVENAFELMSAMPSLARSSVVFEEPGSEVCHRREVALADRAEHADARPLVLVERAHDPLRDLRPYA